MKRNQTFLINGKLNFVIGRKPPGDKTIKQWYEKLKKLVALMTFLEVATKSDNPPPPPGPEEPICWVRYKIDITDPCTKYVPTSEMSPTEPHHHCCTPRGSENLLIYTATSHPCTRSATGRFQEGVTRSRVTSSLPKHPG
ncbi:hypothetical protein AVEN_201524-1 [Araneus ventricosus]|uniref:Uncharacterized protein n=1 Tax=Araneus ventricosus TaxID=182803 RepID=A0A4Y2L2S0_ARAVE|nr:hypothetical protein AVEN_29825-1 [Araneus ventricosus]GBN08833.1 hypothetical protein AVEN_104460-1 [Araneus ventricosus]GBN08849.1 hypothetical protein AVEN_112882-1 [Araneus ventricosus]GBN08898.1 hypothetical protein AVEN_201524-1 [Araneus ventricosus]